MEALFAGGVLLDRRGPSPHRRVRDKIWDHGARIEFLGSVHLEYRRIADGAEIKHEDRVQLYTKRRQMTPVIKFVSAISGLFFDRHHFHGKWFEQRKIGWVWVVKGIWFQKILGFNRKIPIPVNPTVIISNFDNIVLGNNNLNNFQSGGIYFQNYAAKIHLGDDCFIAPNVGFITANHDPNDPEVTLPGKDIVLGAKCWIGMNAVVLPGVTLGPGTVVGAGSVVTKSFPQGSQVIAGNPAKVVRTNP
jgi:acetyltransferase-like isoleucine patch superfamily enzyme